MRILELFESSEPGEYVYHVTNRKNIPHIAEKGLEPNEGYMGKFVYFAYEPHSGFYHIGRNDPDAVILQVSWSDLKSKFGTYREKGPGGIERDDEQIMVPGTVPPDMIEIYEKE